MSDSVRPHRRQPTRLLHPWDCPGKNTGVGCHFLLQCMKVKSESEFPQSCPTLSDPMDCSPPGPLSMGFSRQEYWSGVPLSTALYNKPLQNVVTSIMSYNSGVYLSCSSARFTLIHSDTFDQGGRFKMASLTCLLAGVGVWLENSVFLCVPSHPPVGKTSIVVQKEPCQKLVRPPEALCSELVNLIPNTVK